MNKTKNKVVLEKETVTKEVHGEKVVKVTYRLISFGEHNRSIIITERDLKEIRDQADLLIRTPGSPKPKSHE